MSKTKMTAQQLVAHMNKKHGGFSTSTTKAYHAVDRIPTGLPELDQALGGGFPRGKIIELYGEQGSGKTWVLTKTYAHNKEDCNCVHFDVESSYNQPFAMANGVDFEKLILKDEFGDKDYAEAIFEQIHELCETESVDLIGVDSVAALTPKAELEGSYEQQHVGLLARAMSQALRKLSNVASRTGTTIVFINQTRTAVGKWSPTGTPIDTPGGKALKFYASVRVEVDKRMPSKSNNPEMFDGDDPIAHTLKVKVTKNKTHPPFKKCELELRYVPRDPHEDILLLAMNEALLVKNARDHKKFTYKDEHEFKVDEKGDLQLVWDELRKMELAVDLVITMGKDSHIPALVDLGFLTQKEVDDFLKPTEKKSKESKK